MPQDLQPIAHADSPTLAVRQYRHVRAKDAHGEAIGCATVVNPGIPIQPGATLYCPGCGLDRPASEFDWYPDGGAVAAA